MRVKFYDGKKLVSTIRTNSPSRVIREYEMSTEVEWTRWKIVDDKATHKNERATR